MPSLRAKLVNRYIRSTMKPLPLHEIPPAKLRAIFEKRLVPFKPSGVSCETVDEPVQGEWHRPKDGGANNVILYLHGGGYVFGSARTHRSVTFPLALAANANVFSLNYRLAPDHACPAAIDDALACYQWLRATGVEPKNITIAGDSAGGGLALATLQALRANNEETPAAAILYSPYTDLSVEGGSAKRNAESDAMFQLRSVEMGAKHYAGALSTKDPRVSPLYGDMRGLPPMLIFASTSEILYDDSTRLVRRAEEEGVDVSFVARDGLVHVWPLFHPLMPEARQAIEESAAFIQRYTHQ
ncbi:MAG: alpha/beta hydrolase [Pseudomonadota bacterium]